MTSTMVVKGANRLGRASRESGAGRFAPERLGRLARQLAFCAAAFLSIPALAAPAGSGPVPEDALVVTLLGTGTPLNEPDRYSFSNLVQAGGVTLLIDAGRGAAIRLGQLGVPLGRVDGVFITHFHSDHIVGLGDVFATGYIRVPALGGRTQPLRLYGPRGTARLADGLRTEFKADVDTRIVDEGVPRAGTQIAVTEADEGVVFDRQGVKVTMFKVHHGDNIVPSVGYRVDYKGHSVTFSGDTTFDPRVVAAARGTDVLVHEVGAAPADAANDPVTATILAHHTSPEEAGRVFTDVHPKLAVYSHVVRLFGRDGRVAMRDIISRTRTSYTGPLLVGEDLTQFIIDAKGVTTLRGGN